MRFSKRIFSLIIICLLGCVGLAQDSIPKPYDQNYREDQFYIGITYNVITDVPTDVATRGLSGGLHFGFLRDIPLNERRNVAIAIGAGMSIDRYGQTLFIGEAEDNESIFRILNSEIDYTTNYFSTYTLEAPVEFRWRTSTESSYKFWRIYTGFRIGYSYYYKSVFKQTNNNINQTDIPEFEKLRLGASLSFGYNTFNFYVYYSINPFFKDAITVENQTVDFKTVKVGLMFYIL
ncbi:MAG: PorT family protein [Bacteroidia bacterium]|nr:PorT family protein [Bacteroidia bacterium]NNF30778.1 PorT family protein [Flavobacteriaceae bacterium]MBT8277177.1 PorT family protein [Bacteroidia bacterium]NNJ82710.1 PorT family protein [Flavobacteriaceae bacterium]NNK54754.1 PorT family protein [Flavobacteriaceae bacterium]